MSFQHFRLEATASFVPSPSFQLPGASSSDVVLGRNSFSHPVDPGDPSSSRGQFQVQLNKPQAPARARSVSVSKAPYGSGDADDGYTMSFESMDTFEAWRQKEEEEKVIEFVKGDTHGSKANPPRFKEHTKLVCARHQRSGRKKYVKKHPERVRKVPSRKIEGVGCSASISYKTYFDSPQVRVCYNWEHSHEIGLANLPFTRRGRKAQVEWEKEHKGRRGRPPKNSRAPDGSPSPSATASTSENAVGGPSTSVSYQPPQPIHAISSQSQQSHLAQTISMLAPLPQLPPPVSTLSAGTVERWDRMAILFNAVKDCARTFQHPEASVTALESVLIRLYLESPVPIGAPQVHRPNESADSGGGDFMEVEEEET
ncbi:hypothetical protein OE88DRAFT_1803376 [Heliocybe sulcata]|uniref:Uncharacterized protein n=1 Tax=Heliocybe sulcata TaxID=5364 RepID=A0A5C3NIF9_9AGAM|nr:hypothetical protein OE88DRAFT_1803376 [Heliocybe sulcata]